MLNKALLIGNLGKDPEMRSLPSGQPVASFTLATTKKWRDKNGQKQEQTEWHQIVCFGKQAEIAGQYLTKGKQIYVEGRIQTRTWDDRQTGEKRYRTEIICDNFQMLGQRGGGALGLDLVAHGADVFGLGPDPGDPVRLDDLGELGGHAEDTGEPHPEHGTRAAEEHGLSLGDSWVVGDILDDVEAGRRAGCSRSA